MAEYKLKRALGVCEDLVLDASTLTVDQDRGAGVKTYHTISGKTIPYSGVGCSATMISLNDKIDDNAIKAVSVISVDGVTSIPTGLDDRRKFYFDTVTQTMYWVDETGAVLPLIPKATEAMALEGIDDNSYITPYTLRKVLEDACASGGLCEATEEIDYNAEADPVDEIYVETLGVEPYDVDTYPYPDKKLWVEVNSSVSINVGMRAVYFDIATPNVGIFDITWTDANTLGTTVYNDVTVTDNYSPTPPTSASYITKILYKAVA